MSLLETRPEMLVRGADNRPRPPQDILDRLRRDDPRIGLYYTKCSWAITEAWRENDPRRKRIAEGDMDPEMVFDICGYLPPNVSLESAAGYIASQLRSYTSDEFAAVRHAISHWNDVERPGQIENQIMGEVLETLDTSKIKPISNQVFVSEAVTSDVVPVDRMAKARAAKANKSSTVKTA